ncbi:hypothetical protein HMPREF0063_11404 [Aeromicrobium marinum DSM 15272]|uniref:Tyrosine specific protein phosphatases domain-containing protein n=1 Tax=Aeromicrobium marinum DSM 15272 TaxID=585531 RepID=E2SBJ5_9ACTN|nr:tyrosine-protein phosphatase [Aeromicrobium marinum]EFQ83741.1 hypothetical protein HMPREF0063_11404 [Aeromicrobium marinum DSM 15272]
MPDVVPNLRDLGGVPAADGLTIRPARLLRSAAPWADDVAPPGILWPPTTVVDLRSAMETEHDHPIAGSGVSVVNIPLLAALRPGARIAATLSEMYGVVLDTAADRLVDVVRAVADSEGPALVHCAAGKDRTGVAVALMLSLVGTPREAVVADYLATELHLDAIHARLEASPGAEHRVHLPAEFFTVPVAAILAVLDVWDSHPHGVHGWFRDAGGGSDDLLRLRTHLLGDTMEA